MCGIGAVISTSPLNEAAVKFLAQSQDHRGGDGAGIYYFHNDTPVVEKVWPVIRSSGDRLFRNIKRVDEDSPNEGSTFVDLFFEKELQTPMNYIALVHARKLTRGTYNEEQTHPIVAKGATKKITGVHNGTIFNHDLVCRNLGIEPANNDSLSLFKAMAENRTTSFLGQYKGAVAMIWTENDSKDKLFFFKGITKVVHLKELCST